MSQRLECLTDGGGKDLEATNVDGSKRDLAGQVNRFPL
jgi:hypothetical protein